MSILVIVESPGKISKISQILGKKYIIQASYGHIRDLDPKKMSIDFDNHFEPIYIITKPDVVKKLKDAMKGVDMVYLASDLDREGAQIAQSLYDVLKPKNYKRLIFNAITKEAIMDAIKNAGKIDENLVNAQKARRVLDRLFGYLISPILQKQIGGKLSAGRVQSIATKIIIDKENEIKDFLDKNLDSTFFKVNGSFSKIKATLYESTDKKPYAIKSAIKSAIKNEFKGKIAHVPIIEGNNPNAKVIIFLKRCLKSEFMIHSITDRMAIRSPAPPFTTSTLQQEANRKFGMSIDSTMKTAQKLYEGGYITYMRTDSVEISPEGHQQIKKVIEDEFGKEYYQKNIYKIKKGHTEEAHEAIRLTHPDLLSLEKEINDPYQIKLYKLIWQRTIASQMKQAKIKITTIQITISKYINDKIEPFYYFQSQIEKIIFPGFMKVYVESTDEPDEQDESKEDNTTKNFIGNIPEQDQVGKIIIMEEIVAKQDYLKPPSRYTQASLVKKLEELGIGRPSTYVNTIKTILDRSYVKVGDIPGIKKDITIYTINSKNNKHVMSIVEEDNTILLGKEAKKMIPTKLGQTVNEYLVEHFPEMMDYKFTAKMETELDDVASGKKQWYKVVQNFYDRLKPIVDELISKESISKTSEKFLGTDADNNEIYATIAKYGPVVVKKVGSKKIYAPIIEPLTLDTITLIDAIKILEYPKLLGKYKNKDVALQKGQYGLYIIYDKERYSIGENITKDINLEQAIKIIEDRKSNNLAEFNIIHNGKKIKAIILNGKYGPYIQIKQNNKKINYPIPKDIDPQNLTEEKILEIITKKKTFKAKGGANIGAKSGTKKKYGGSKTSNKNK